MTPLNQIDIECVWLATSYYDDLKELDKEELSSLSEECVKLHDTYPLHNLLDKEFELKALNGKFKGINVMVIYAVCKDILSDYSISKNSAYFSSWLLSSKKQSGLIH